MLSRRLLIPSFLALPAAAFAAGGGDLSLACDPEVAWALESAAGAFRVLTGVRVHVHPTPPALLLPQLRRDVQNDILFCRAAILEQAMREGLVSGDAPARTWRNRLVLARRRGDAGKTGPVAVADRLPGNEVDAAAVLASLGLSDAATTGAAHARDIAFLLTSGAAGSGLLHLTDVLADPALEVAAKVDDAAYPPILYRAAVSRLARRGNPGAFLDYLLHDPAALLLAQAGLAAA
jgi:molybdate transport system substrate-binding protein